MRHAFENKCFNPVFPDRKIVLIVFVVLLDCLVKNSIAVVHIVLVSIVLGDV